MSDISDFLDGSQEQMLYRQQLEIEHEDLMADYRAIVAKIQTRRKLLGKAPLATVAQGRKMKR